MNYIIGHASPPRFGPTAKIARIDIDPAEIGATLVRQVTSPVLWAESLNRGIASGATRFVEIGPGKVLRGLVKQIKRDAGLFGVENAQSLEETVKGLTG